jgi:hypothetical protein
MNEHQHQWMTRYDTDGKTVLVCVCQICNAVKPA